MICVKNPIYAPCDNNMSQSLQKHLSLHFFNCPDTAAHIILSDPAISTYVVSVRTLCGWEQHYYAISELKTNSYLCI